MKTPQQWLETVDFDWDEQVSVRMIEAIQQDAFESGRVDGLKRAVEIVSLRIATPKNEAFTAAIEEAKVFLGAEIERGGKPAYCVCQSTPNPLKSPSL